MTECGRCGAPVKAIFRTFAEFLDGIDVLCTTCGTRNRAVPRWSCTEEGPFDIVRWWCKHGVVDFNACAACDSEERA